MDRQTNKQLDKFWQLLFDKVPRFGTKIASSAQYILAAVMSSRERRFIPSDVVPILEDGSKDLQNCPCTILKVEWPNHHLALFIADETVTMDASQSFNLNLLNNAENWHRIVAIIVQYFEENPRKMPNLPRHPEQPTALFGKVVRFKHNSIVQMLLETSTRWDYYSLLESFRVGDLSLDDWLQFNQLIGSTLTAYQEATLGEE